MPLETTLCHLNILRRVVSRVYAGASQGPPWCVEEQSSNSTLHLGILQKIPLTCSESVIKNEITT